MNRSKRSILIGFLIGIILLLLWSFNIDFGELISSFRSVRYQFVLVAGAFYLLAYFTRSIRWNILLRNQIRLSLKESWIISSAGNWINYIIPIRAGELVKAVLIKKLKKTRAITVLPSIFIDKFFDTLGIFFIIVFIPFMGIEISRGLRILIVLLIAIFIIVFGILILAATYKKGITKFLSILYAWLPQAVSQRIDNLIATFVDGLNIFEHHKSTIIYALLLTTAGVIFDGLYFFFIFQAFNQDFLFLKILFGYTLMNLSYALPQPPAQLGSNQWMMIIIFSLGFGFDKNIASSIMVFAHLFTACIITALGIAGFSYAGVKSMQQIRKEML